jgi:hypothetical protein
MLIKGVFSKDKNGEQAFSQGSFFENGEVRSYPKRKQPTKQKQKDKT